MTDNGVEHVVLDASAMVDLLLSNDKTEAVVACVVDATLHVPAHFDAEVLSALGRIQRAGQLTAEEVEAALRYLQKAPLSRHLLPDLLTGAWSRRADLRLLDAFYIELAEQLDVPLITTDERLARACGRAQIP